MAIAATELQHSLTVRIDKEALAAALTEAGKVVHLGSALPILSAVRLSAEVQSQTVAIEATNLEMFYRRTIPAYVESAGEVCIPIRALRSVVKLAPKKARLTLGATEGECTVTIGQRDVSLTAYPAADFPTFPHPTAPWGHASDGERFGANLTAIASVASTDEGRPVLTAVLLGSTRLVATDSYRLGIIEDGTWTCEPGAAELLVPSRALRIFASMLGKHPAAVEMSADASGQFCLTSGNLTIVTRTIDGRFLDYQRLIPDMHKATLSVSWDVAFAVEAIATAASFLGPSQPIKVETVGTKVSLLATNTGVADSSETLAGSKATGADLLAGFNPAFLAAGLRFITSELVEMRGIDSARPFVFGCTGSGKGERVYLLMPVRLWS